MDRRKFLMGALGVAGAAVTVSVLRPAEAMAAMPGGRGVLDQLDGPVDEAVDYGKAVQAEPVWHRGYRHDYGYGYGYRRRPRPRYVWRRVCRRVRGYYGWTRRCWRERVRVW